MQRLSGPIDVQLELTENCNFRCRHCYNYWRYGVKSEKSEMDVAQVLGVIDTLKERGVSVITLTGGEPLLRPYVLFASLKAAKRVGMEVGLNTNATLITPDIAKRLREDGLDHVLCSLLGKDATHNLITGAKAGFSQTITGIENLVKAGLSVAVNMVVSKMNQTEVFEVGKFVKQLGARTFCATPMVPSHESNRPYVLSGSECKQALRTLLAIRETFGLNVDTLEPVARCLFDETEDDEFTYFFGNRICSAAVTSCAVSSAGLVRPCIHADKSFGNVLIEEFPAIWEKMSPWSEESMLPPECVSCAATAICEGGCRMSSKTLHGCYNGKDMYMSEPIKAYSRVAKLPARKSLVGNITTTEKVKVNPLARMRREGFGGVVYVGSNVEFLSAEGFDLVQVMLCRDSFSLAEMAEEVGLDVEDVRDVTLRLLGNKVVLREDGR